MRAITKRAHEPNGIAVCTGRLQLLLLSEVDCPEIRSHTLTCAHYLQNGFRSDLLSSSSQANKRYCVECLSSLRANRRANARNSLEIVWWCQNVREWFIIKSVVSVLRNQHTCYLVFPFQHFNPPSASPDCSRCDIKIELNLKLSLLMGIWLDLAHSCHNQCIRPSHNTFLWLV